MHDAPSGFQADFYPEIPGRVDPASVPQRLAADQRRRRSLLVDSSAEFSPLDDAVFRDDRWQWLLRGAFGFSENIMLLEGRTTLLGLRHAGRNPFNHCSRLLSISDNLNSLFSFEKMRSKNRGLLMFCRRAAAHVIACAFLWWLRCSESSRNPTDGDSRLADASKILPGGSACPIFCSCFG